MTPQKPKIEERIEELWEKRKETLIGVQYKSDRENFKAGARAILDLPELKGLFQALEFYSNKDNWMKSYIFNVDKEDLEPSSWADKLKIQDCAMLNCGGGRARMALTQWGEFTKGSGE